jgi:hypothetical protein
VAEPEAVPHIPGVQLPEPEINLPANAAAHTNTIGVQADNNVINGEDIHCHLKQSSYSFLVHWVHQHFDVTTRQDLCTEAPIFFPLNFD